MKNQSSIFLPRNVGGLICCLARKADGGAEVVAWNGQSWVSANIPAGDVLAAPVASDRRLAEFGIWLTPRGRAAVKEAHPRKIWDPEEAEDRGLERMFAALRNKQGWATKAPMDPEEAEDRGQARLPGLLANARTTRPYKSSQATKAPMDSEGTADRGVAWVRDILAKLNPDR